MTQWPLRMRQRTLVSLDNHEPRAEKNMRQVLRLFSRREHDQTQPDQFFWHVFLPPGLSRSCSERSV